MIWAVTVESSLPGVLLSLLSSSMADLSVNASNVQPGHCRMSPQEQSLSSQESCNRANQRSVSNCCKNGGIDIGSQASEAVPVVPTTSEALAETGPISGPYFTCIVSKSLIQPPYQVVVPRKFCPLLPSACVLISLFCQNKTWKTRYCGDRNLKRFDSGWKCFAIDNNLKVGDGLVFELMDSKNPSLMVRILHGFIPSPIVNKTDGESSESPIMID